MIRSKVLPLILLCLFFANCETQKHEFPIDKRYWDTDDYEKVVLELNYGYEADEALPSFNDPETRIIVEKLTDQQNFNVVLADEELGLDYRNDQAEKFFKAWKGMADIYNAKDRRDKYINDIENVMVWHFGIALQLKYFKLGNDHIKENADDPDSSRPQRRIRSNIQTLISNFLIYLDKVNEEASFSDKGKEKLAEGIDKHFTALVELYPDADYSDMRRKADLLKKKSKSESIKTSLDNLIKLIDSKKETTKQN
ncbi:hypothetical protein ACJD0Z_17080 [Flavobacteriaceae bacterium M23B6Z8]